MIDGERLSQRMTDCGVSQAELARDVGVSQPTIYRLVHGMAYGSKQIHLIARRLKTTPAYLTRETDDPYSENADEIELASDERELITCYRGLAAGTRAALMQVARSMYQNAGGVELSANGRR